MMRSLIRRQSSSSSQQSIPYKLQLHELHYTTVNQLLAEYNCTLDDSTYSITSDREFLAIAISNELFILPLETATTDSQISTPHKHDCHSYQVNLSQPPYNTIQYLAAKQTLSSTRKDVDEFHDEYDDENDADDSTDTYSTRTITALQWCDVIHRMDTRSHIDSDEINDSNRQISQPNELLFVGWSNGIIEIYNTERKLLIQQLLYNDAIHKFQFYYTTKLGYMVMSMIIQYDSSKEKKSSTASSVTVVNATNNNSKNMNIIAYVDGGSLMNSIKNVMENMSFKNTDITTKSSPATSIMDMWSYHKYQLIDQQVVNDLIAINPITPYDIDQYIEGSYQQLPSIIGVGSDPLIGYYICDEHGSSLEINPLHLAQDVAKKVRSAVYGYASNYAKSWWSSSSRQPPSEEEILSQQQQQVIDAMPHDLDWSRSIKDEQRVIQRILLDPTCNYAVLCDNLSRVILLDVRQLLTIRMWKGYRDAQTAFIRIPNSAAHASSPSASAAASEKVAPGLYIVILAPQRGLLECWRIPNGKRVAYAHVEINSTLLSASAVVSFSPACGIVRNTFMAYLSSKAGNVYSIELTLAPQSDRNKTPSAAPSDQLSLTMMHLERGYDEYVIHHSNKCAGEACKHSGSKVKQLCSLVETILHADGPSVDKAAQLFHHWFFARIIQSKVMQNTRHQVVTTLNISSDLCNSLHTSIIDTAVATLHNELKLGDIENDGDAIEVINPDGSTTSIRISSHAFTISPHDLPGHLRQAAMLYNKLHALQQLKLAYENAQKLSVYHHSCATFLSMFAFVEMMPNAPMTHSSSPPASFTLCINDFINTLTADSLDRVPLQQLSNAVFGESELSELYLSQGGLDTLMHIQKSDLSAQHLAYLFAAWFLQIHEQKIRLVEENASLYQQPLRLYSTAMTRLVGKHDLVNAMVDVMHITYKLDHAIALIRILLTFLMNDKNKNKSLTAEEQQEDESDANKLRSLLRQLCQLRLVRQQLPISSVAILAITLHSFTSDVPLSGLIAKHVVNSNTMATESIQWRQKKQIMNSGESVASTVITADKPHVLSYDQICDKVQLFIRSFSSPLQNADKPLSTDFKLTTDVESVIFYCAYELYKQSQHAKNVNGAQQLYQAALYLQQLRPSSVAGGLCLAMYESIVPYISALVDATLIDTSTSVANNSSKQSSSNTSAKNASSNPSLYIERCRELRPRLQREERTLYDITNSTQVSHILQAAAVLIDLLKSHSETEERQIESSAHKTCDVLIASPSLQITKNNMNKMPEADALQQARERTSCNSMFHAHVRIADSESTTVPYSNIGNQSYNQYLMKWANSDHYLAEHASEAIQIAYILRVLHELNIDMNTLKQQNIGLRDMYSMDTIHALQYRTPITAMQSDQDNPQQQSQSDSRILFLMLLVRHPSGRKHGFELSQMMRINDIERQSLMHEYVLSLLERGEDSKAYDDTSFNSDVAVASLHVSRSRLGLFLHSLEHRNKQRYNQVIAAVPSIAWSWLSTNKPPAITSLTPTGRTSVTVKQKADQVDIHAASVLLRRSKQVLEKELSSHGYEVRPMDKKDMFNLSASSNSTDTRTNQPLIYARAYAIQLNEIVNIVVSHAR